MPAVTYLNASCTGHFCFPPRPNIQASSDVFVNGIGVHRQGDSWAIHVCGKSFHGGNLAKGSGTVYINGKQCGRIGDPVSCGSFVAQGSNNVFAGG